MELRLLETEFLNSWKEEFIFSKKKDCKIPKGNKNSECYFSKRDLVKKITVCVRSSRAYFDTKIIVYLFQSPIFDS